MRRATTCSPRLRELGIIEPATVRSKAHAKKTGELILRGKHDPPKTPNSAYTLSEEAKELLDTPPDQWEAALDEFVRGDEKRRVQFSSRSQASTSPRRLRRRRASTRR